MTGNGGFAEKAKEVEALAASTENHLLRITLRILAHDYRTLAEQEDEEAQPSTSEANKSKVSLRTEPS